MSLTYHDVGNSRIPVAGGLGVNPIGTVGTVGFSAFWADTVYADSDKWISTTGCNEFTVSAWDTLATSDHGLIIAWSSTYDADLSAVIAAVQTGTASVVKTAKETTLTSSANVGVLKSDNLIFRRFSETPIRTIRIVAVTADKACLLDTVTA